VHPSVCSAALVTSALNRARLLASVAVQVRSLHRIIARASLARLVPTLLPALPLVRLALLVPSAPTTSRLASNVKTDSRPQERQRPRLAQRASRVHMPSPEMQPAAHAQLASLQQALVRRHAVLAVLALTLARPAALSALVARLVQCRPQLVPLPATTAMLVPPAERAPLSVLPATRALSPLPPVLPNALLAPLVPSAAPLAPSSARCAPPAFTRILRIPFLASSVLLAATPLARLKVQLRALSVQTDRCRTQRRLHV
jgi:hypothetical protein